MNAMKPMPDSGDAYGRTGAVPVGHDLALPDGRISGQKRTGRRIFAAVVAVLLIGGLAIGSWQHFRLHAEVTATAAQRRELVPSVRVAVVRANGEHVTVTLPGTTDAFEQANLYSRTSGYVAKRYADIGDRVQKGALLAEITAPELDHQIAQAQANLAQNEAALRRAQADRELAEVTWDRDSKLLTRGWVTRQQGDQERLALTAQQAAESVAMANIEAQRSQIRMLGQQKAYQRVVAPFDGVITTRNIDNGSLVKADDSGATSMFTMMNSDVIRIFLYVPQDQAFGLKAGVEAVVRVPELPGMEFRGTVTRVANALQPGTRTLLTEIDVPNPDGTLTPGTYVDVRLQIPRKTASLIVPAEAIIFNRNGLSVAVVENGAVHLRKIVEVRDLGTSIEVSDGVKDGDQVVLNPAVDISENQAVNARVVTVGK